MFQVFLSTFGLVFLAELGDKTQLATLLLAAQQRTVWPVFLGSASALVLSSLIGAVAGSALSRVVPASYIQAGAGIAFVVLGILLLLGRF